MAGQYISQDERIARWKDRPSLRKRSQFEKLEFDYNLRPGQSDYLARQNRIRFIISSAISIVSSSAGDNLRICLLYEFGMGVMDNMVHTESSKLSSLSNGTASKEKLGGTVLQNGSYNTAPMGRPLKFKRRKVYAVRDFPPGCGSVAMGLRSRMEVENCENGNVADGDLRGSGCVRSAKVESSAKEKENLGQPDDHLKSIDEPQPCNDMDVGVTDMPEPGLEPMKDESDEFKNGKRPEDMNLQKNTSDLHMVKPVEAQPLTICYPDDNENSNNPEMGGRSIARMKPLHGRKVSVVRDFPSKTGNKFSNSEKTLKVAVSMEKNLVLEKSGSTVSSSGRQNMENLVRDIVVYTDEQSHQRDHLDQSLAKKSNATFPKPNHVASKKKAKKGVAFHLPLKLTKKINREYGEGSKTKNSETISPDIEDSPGQELVRQSQTLHVDIPPSRPSGSSSGDSIRNKVKETLRLFHGACRKLLQEEEAKPQKKGSRKLRVDFEASKILKSKGKYLNTGNQIMGSVPGTEVGDEFQYRMELNILGIHRPSQGGIDYMKDGEELVATSIVASGGYDDELDNSDVLIYTGQGGNVIKVNKKGKEDKEPEDQQLVKGNLALANSITKKNPVRVIRGNKKAALESSGDAKGRTYVYDGLYVVEEFWQETGSHGKLVFKYKLRRMPGQPELSWKVVKKTKKSKYREGLCKLDISEGKERLPICAVNEIDDEKPPSFIYTSKMIYPDWCRPIPPKGCGCTTRCTEARNCACVSKNNGEIPYNYDGAVVGFKPLIYECGPLCKCPPSCYLRVAQRGIKFQLEIFKTKSRGWGVRSLNSISPGSFICEYVGELLEDREAERRTGNDEYLFDIGNKYDNPLVEEMSKLMPETRMEEEENDDTSSGFTIDAAAKGNIGRFINHSCSPNLYAQNVLYDHEDSRIPHVMFFAMDNIPPLQELSYHYNYVIDQVRDSNGNIKKKNCYCGSSECTGRLY